MKTRFYECKTILGDTMIVNLSTVSIIKLTNPGENKTRYCQLRFPDGHTESLDASEYGNIRAYVEKTSREI